MHDIIEDTDVTKEDFIKEFGDYVVEIVNDVTEQDKSLSWVERKLLALEHVADMREEAVLVKTADVMHNMTEQIMDYKEIGDEMFVRFNASKEQQLLRYERLVTAIGDKEVHNPLLMELTKRLAELQELWR